MLFCSFHSLAIKCREERGVGGEGLPVWLRGGFVGLLGIFALLYLLEGCDVALWPVSGQKKARISGLRCI